MEFVCGLLMFVGGAIRKCVHDTLDELWMNYERFNFLKVNLSISCYMWIDMDWWCYNVLFIFEILISG